MSAGIIGKLKKFFTMESEEIELEPQESIEYRSMAGEVKTYREEPMTSSTSISLPSAHRKQEIVVFQPATFNEAQQVAEHIKAKKMVIVNMKRTDKELAKRIIDFLSGINYAVDGRVQKITDNIFLFAPSHIQVTMVDDTEGGQGEESVFSRRSFE